MFTILHSTLNAVEFTRHHQLIIYQRISYYLQETIIRVINFKQLKRLINIWIGCRYFNTKQQNEEDHAQQMEEYGSWHGLGTWDWVSPLLSLLQTDFFMEADVCHAILQHTQAYFIIISAILGRYHPISSIYCIAIFYGNRCLYLF